MEKIILVTGQKSGIGKSIFETLIESKAYTVFGFEGDVSKCEDWIANALKIDMALDTSEQDAQLWAVINCAGIAEAKGIMDIDIETFDKMMAVNCTSILHSVQVMAHTMIDDATNVQKKEPVSTEVLGHFVNITSVSALTGFSSHGHYCASKFAANGLSQVAAKELSKYGIMVNCICPSPTDTPMWDKLDKEYSKLNGVEPGELDYMQKQLIKRIGYPKDVSDLVEFIISDKNKYITGTNIKVCGGNIIG